MRRKPKTQFRLDGQRGVALIAALLMVLIFSTLGTVSLNLAAHEVENMGAIRDEAVARHLAEAGADLVVQWFHDPNAIPSGTVGDLLAKRYEVPNVGATFFDAQGNSQFVGTADRPDLLLDASVPAQDRLLNDASTGWFRSLRTLGRILRLKVYGPMRPGLLCTVAITAGVGQLQRTLSVQLGAISIPPLRAGVQVGSGGEDRGPAGLLPVWLHWGDLKVKGDARFGASHTVPVQTTLAAVTGQSYGEMSRPEDRWMKIWVGGEAFFTPSSAGAPTVLPANVYPHRDPLPGLNEDRWDYETMKKYALLYGAYYTIDRDGLLYRHGKIEPGLGIAPDQVFGSQAVGDHHGLVFVDTLDQRPPRPDNLGTISVEAAYSEGLFIVNAHVNFKAKGSGKSVPALSPPRPGSASLATRVPVQLAGIHFQGVLYSAGDLSVEGRPRIYGALMVNGRMRQGADIPGALELWYTYDLQQGLVRGMPLVYIAPGTWSET